MKWLLWPAVLACTAWLYLPGLGGGFRLDDSLNLAGLSRIQPGNLFQGTLSYVLQGFAGPSGRPLSLLSFALQYQDWPDNPRAFLTTNLVIHLFNGTLLLLTAWKASQSARSAGRTGFWVAVGATTLWLLWPIHSSTVLYVVQRMALLAATCMIIGMLLYLLAREALDGNRTAKAHALFALSWLIGLPLGILCKETAIVFPLLVMALDLLRYKSLPQRSRPLSWTLMLVLPLAGFALYLLLDPAPLSGYRVRDFGMYERVLTQPRVLWMYAAQVLAPARGAFQFSYDDLTVSRGLLQPPATLLALLAWVTLVTLAMVFRRRQPVAAFTLLFFLANHALESSILPLEMAFEHRNYLASFGLAYGASFAFVSCMQLRSNRMLSRILAASAVAYVAWISWVAYDVHRLWGDELAMAAYQHRRQPESLRAVTALSEALVHAGQRRQAAAVLQNAEARFPNDPVLPILAAELACVDFDLDPPALPIAVDRVARATTNVLSAFAAVDRLSSAVENGSCPSYPPAEVLSLVEAAKGNSAMAHLLPDLLLIAGRLHMASGQTDTARSLLKESIRLRPKPDVVVQAAAWEIGRGNLTEARRYIAILGADGPLSWRQRLAIAGDREKLQAWLNEVQGN